MRFSSYAYVPIGDSEIALSVRLRLKTQFQSYGGNAIDETCGTEGLGISGKIQSGNAGNRSLRILLGSMNDDLVDRQITQGNACGLKT